MQIVYLSKCPKILAETIGYVENLARFITEIVVICPENLLKKFEFQSGLKIRLFSDEELLDRKIHAAETMDHQMKNWLLRVSLADHHAIEDEFIMADDDSRPLVNIPLSYFKDGGKYKSFYFCRLENWYKWESAYDGGQHNTCEVLRDRGYTALSFSSHMPQIINKAFLQEAVKAFEGIGTKKSIDEWSVYFNFCLKEFPKYFNKPRAFETLCWPALPTDWPYYVRPKGFCFENFYPELYGKNMLFQGIPTQFNIDRHLEYTIEKVKRRLEIQFEYDQMKNLLELSYDFSQKLDLLYDEIHFEKKGYHFLITNLPKIIFARANSNVDVDIEVETRGEPLTIDDLKGRKAIKLSFHWLDQHGVCFSYGWNRYSMPGVLTERKSAPMVLRIPIHKKKPGIYMVALDMVKGNGVWFDGENFSYKILFYVYG